MQNAKTGVDIAKQNLQQVSFNRQYANIYAPADGFIVKKLANTGELASPGSPVLFMNASSGSSKWILKAGLSDQGWALVDNGNEATINFDAFPGVSLPAVVSKKALAADPVSGSFQVELEVNFGKRQPAIGMFGKASITPSKSSVGFRIPYDALLEANGKKGFVFVSDDRKTVKKIEVTIASMDDKVAYISSGLEGHAFIVSSGSPYLNDQSTIVVKQ
jgi:RND family efflux transporter MFP subunit